MPKATVTIDLPDGWELADTKMRKAKPGEYRWLPAVGKPYRLESASEGECFIVRRIATEYVNVKLRREDAKHFATDRDDEISAVRLAAACREALSERCGVKWCGLSMEPDRKCNGLADHNPKPCTLPAGHAGPHGV